MKSLERSNDQLDCSPVTLTRCASSVLVPRAFFASHWWNKVTIVLMMAMTCCLMQVGLAATAENVPKGVIELSGGSVAAGIGYSWGSGKLIYEGKEYPLKISGLSIIHVGISSYTATGTVFDLFKPSDINGVYSAVSAGAAVAGGASVLAMKNTHGVLIEMTSAHVGVNFSLGVKGVTITLEQ